MNGDCRLNVEAGDELLVGHVANTLGGDALWLSGTARLFIPATPDGDAWIAKVLGHLTVVHEQRAERRQQARDADAARDVAAARAINAAASTEPFGTVSHAATVRRGICDHDACNGVETDGSDAA